MPPLWSHTLKLVLLKIIKEVEEQKLKEESLKGSK